MWDVQTQVLCPDCNSLLTIRLVLLTDDGRIVSLAACQKCNDHVSVRCFLTVDKETFVEAAKRGMPIVNYGRAEAG